MRVIWIVLVVLGCKEFLAEVAIQTNKRPILQSEERETVYIQADTHTLYLQMDLKSIDQSLKDIQVIVETGLNHLHQIYQTDGADPKVKMTREMDGQDTVKFGENSKEEGLFTTTLGKVHIQMATTLVDLKSMQKSFHNYLVMMFPGRISTFLDQDQENMEFPIGHILAKEISKMHDSQLGELANRNISVRMRRQAIEEHMERLPHKAGWVAANIGMKYVDGLWALTDNEKWSISQGQKVKQDSILDLFKFTNIVAHTVNLTTKYLKETHRINAKLISAVFKTADLVVETRDDMEKDKVVNGYLASLIRTHYALVDLKEHIDKIKKAISVDNFRLSSYILEPRDLKEYIGKLKEIPGYTPVIDTDKHLHVYYTMLTVEKSLLEGVLTYKLDIPIKLGEEVEQTWIKLKLFNFPFHIQDKIVTLKDNFPKNIIYNVNDHSFFDTTACKDYLGTMICKPKVYERSKCLERIVEGEGWEQECTFEEFREPSFFGNVWADKFLYLPKQEGTLKCACSMETFTNNRMKVIWKDMTFDLPREVSLIEIPVNCTCDVQKYYIPRRGQVISGENVTWNWVDTYNISTEDFDIRMKKPNDSQLLEFIYSIKDSFEALEKKYNTSYPNNFMIKWGWPLQISHMSIFGICVCITIGYLAAVCWKRKTQDSLQARVDGETLRLNVISVENGL